MSFTALMFQVCNTSKQLALNSKFFLLQIYMSQENIDIPKYLAFLLKTSLLYPEESVQYYFGNYHEPES